MSHVLLPSQEDSFQLTVFSFQAWTTWLWYTAACLYPQLWKVLMYWMYCWHSSAFSFAEPSSGFWRECPCCSEHCSDSLPLTCGNHMAQGWNSVYGKENLLSQWQSHQRISHPLTRVQCLQEEKNIYIYLYFIYINIYLFLKMTQQWQTHFSWILQGGCITGNSVEPQIFPQSSSSGISAPSGHKVLRNWRQSIITSPASTRLQNTGLKCIFIMINCLACPQ